MAEITLLSIANRACAMIGVNPLQSLDDETPGGQSAALIIDSLLDFCLALHPWTFTRQTVELNRVTDAAPKNGFAYEYVIPKGFRIKPNRMLRSKDNEDVLTRFEFEGDRLHCDEQQVFAQLLIEQHPERWAGDFRHAFTVALAGEFAMSMADDKAVEASKKSEALGPPSAYGRGGLMGVAIQNDARNAPTRKLPQNNPLIDAWHS